VEQLAVQIRDKQAFVRFFDDSSKLGFIAAERVCKRAISRPGRIGPLPLDNAEVVVGHWRGCLE